MRCQLMSNQVKEHLSMHGQPLMSSADQQGGLCIGSQHVRPERGSHGGRDVSCSLDGKSA